MVRRRRIDRGGNPAGREETGGRRDNGEQGDGGGGAGNETTEG